MITDISRQGFIEVDRNTHTSTLHGGSLTAYAVRSEGKHDLYPWPFSSPLCHFVLLQHSSVNGNSDTNQFSCRYPCSYQFSDACPCRLQPFGAPIVAPVRAQVGAHPNDPIVIDSSSKSARERATGRRLYTKAITMLSNSDKINMKHHVIDLVGDGAELERPERPSPETTREKGWESNPFSAPRKERMKRVAETGVGVAVPCRSLSLGGGHAIPSGGRPWPEANQEGFGCDHSSGIDNGRIPEPARPEQLWSKLDYQHKEELDWNGLQRVLRKIDSRRSAIFPLSSTEGRGFEIGVRMAGPRRSLLARRKQCLAPMVATTCSGGQLRQ